MKIKKSLRNDIFTFKNNTYRIIFISESFQITEERDFWNACNNFWNKLVQVSPFNFLRTYNNYVEIYGCYEPSNSLGPLLNEDKNPVNRTLLDSKLDTTVGSFSINKEKLNDIYSHIKAEIKDGKNEEDQSTLIVVLLPEIDNYLQGVEKEFTITENNSLNFVCTTINGNWEQVVLHAFARLIGLKEEYSLDGEQYNEASESEGYWLSFFYPNLIYNPFESNEISRNEIKWRNLTNISNSILKINPFEYFEENTYNYQNDELDLWEGGGGFRKQIYRSSKNCLLRYRIGGEGSPLKNKRIPFCPICEHQIKSEIFKAERNFEFPFNQISPKT